MKSAGLSASTLTIRLSAATAGRKRPLPSPGRSCRTVAPAGPPRRRSGRASPSKSRMTAAARLFAATGNAADSASAPAPSPSRTRRCAPLGPSVVSRTSDFASAFRSPTARRNGFGAEAGGPSAKLGEHHAQPIGSHERDVVPRVCVEATDGDRCGVRGEAAEGKDLLDPGTGRGTRSASPRERSAASPDHSVTPIQPTMRARVRMVRVPPGGSNILARAGPRVHHRVRLHLGDVAAGPARGSQRRWNPSNPTGGGSSGPRGRASGAMSGGRRASARSAVERLVRSRSPEPGERRLPPRPLVCRARGDEPQAEHLPLPAVRRAPPRAERAHARRARGPVTTPPPRPHQLRGGGAAVGTVASARGRGSASEAGLEVVVVEVARDRLAERGPARLACRKWMPAQTRALMFSRRASERLRQLRVVAFLLLLALNATRSVWKNTGASPGSRRRRSCGLRGTRGTAA